MSFSHEIDNEYRYYREHDFGGLADDDRDSYDPDDYGGDAVICVSCHDVTARRHLSDSTPETCRFCDGAAKSRLAADDLSDELRACLPIFDRRGEMVFPGWTNGCL